MGMDNPKGEYVKLPKHHFWVFDKTRDRVEKYDYKLLPKVFKVPTIFAMMSSSRYLTDTELEELFRWIVFESKQYTDEVFVEKDRTNQSSRFLKEAWKEQHPHGGLRIDALKGLADHIDDSNSDVIVQNPRST